MCRALRALHVAHERRLPGSKKHAAVPSYGLMIIQFTGPWMEAGLPIGAQLARTHWLGVASASELGSGPDEGDRYIYDINVEDEAGLGGWVTSARWKAEVLPELLASYPKADGRFFVRESILIWGS